MQDKLKPCPFCGSEDIDPEGVAFYPQGKKENGLQHAPACNDCNATADDWNTRTPEKQSTPEELRHDIDRVNKHIEYALTSVNGDKFEIAKAIENIIHHATRAEVEVVTFDEFAKRMTCFHEASRSFFRELAPDISKAYPNGLLFEKGGEE